MDDLEAFIGEDPGRICKAGRFYKAAVYRSLGSLLYFML